MHSVPVGCTDNISITPCISSNYNPASGTDSNSTLTVCLRKKSRACSDTHVFFGMKHGSLEMSFKIGPRIRRIAGTKKAKAKRVTIFQTLRFSGFGRGLFLARISRIYTDFGPQRAPRKEQQLNLARISGIYTDFGHRGHRGHREKSYN